MVGMKVGYRVIPLVPVHIDHHTVEGADTRHDTTIPRLPAVTRSSLAQLTPARAAGNPQIPHVHHRDAETPAELGAGDRIRTDALPFTRSTAPCTKRPNCIDDADYRPDGTHHTGIIRHVGPRTGPRPRRPSLLVRLLYVTSSGRPAYVREQTHRSRSRVRARLTRKPLRALQSETKGPGRNPARAGRRPSSASVQVVTGSEKPGRTHCAGRRIPAPSRQPPGPAG
jgi:hypothetical protein